jgi:hypothetical protein
MQTQVDRAFVGRGVVEHPEPASGAVELTTVVTSIAGMPTQAVALLGHILGHASPSNPDDCSTDVLSVKTR